MENTKGYVYFIKEALSGYVKVGFSTRPNQRLCALQIANPNLLEVIHQEPANPSDELRIQQELQKYKIRGEWFCLPFPLSLYIKNGVFSLTNSNIIEDKDFIYRFDDYFHDNRQGDYEFIFTHYAGHTVGEILQDDDEAIKALINNHDLPEFVTQYLFLRYNEFVKMKRGSS